MLSGSNHTAATFWQKYTQRRAHCSQQLRVDYGSIGKVWVLRHCKGRRPVLGVLHQRRQLDFCSFVKLPVPDCQPKLLPGTSTGERGTAVCLAVRTARALIVATACRLLRNPRGPAHVQ